MSDEPSPLRVALLGFSILAVAIGVGRFAFTPLLPVMEGEGLLNVSSGGVLASVHFVGYAMGALLAGYLSANPRAALLLSLSLIGLTTLAMGLTDSYVAWLAARWLAGVCGAIALVIVSTYFVRRLVNLRRSDMQGLVFSGVGSGIGLVGLAMLLVMAIDLSSHAGWISFGLATLIATGLMYKSLDTDLFTSTPGVQSANIIGGESWWQIVLPYGALGAGYIIPATYLPVMAKQSIESPLVFGWVWPIFGFTAAVSTVLAARLQKTYSNRQIWIVSQLVMAAGLLMPALWPEIVAIIVGGICVGSTFMVVTMIGIKEAHRVAHPDRTHFLVALMTTSFAIGQIIGPVLAGWAYDVSGSFTYSLLVGGALLVFTLAPMLKSLCNASVRRSQ